MLNLKIDKEIKELLDCLGEEIDLPRLEITKNAIKIFAFLYGKYKDGEKTIFRDKKGNEGILKFDDFLFRSKKLKN